jgi:predicted acetyltransferase
VSWSVRTLTAGDAEAARQLGFEAFGVPTSAPSAPATVDQPGMTWFGAFRGPTLVARLVDRVYDSCFGGAVVATAGIAGVTVAAEHRGQGVLTPLLAAGLAAAKERGAIISTLFPTAPRIYRRFGYEVVAEYCTVEVPTRALADVVPGATDGILTRRAEAGDFDAIRAVYDAWAVQQNGPLTRRGVSFPTTAEDFLDSFTGVTVAVDATGAVHGFTSWNRGQGYGEDAVLEVSDLLASDAPSYRALLHAVGSFSSVTAQTRIDTSGDDVIRTFLPSLQWRVVDSSPYMLKILDVPAALRARRYPFGFSARLAFVLAGDFTPENNGGYVLELTDGATDCRPAEVVDRVFTPQGLALLYAGAQSCANLRTAGHLSGGDLVEDLAWDALFGGRQRHIRDYF